MREHFLALLEQRDKALKLQHMEYQRRLGELDRQVEDIRLVLGELLPRERFEAYVKAEAARRENR